MRLLANRLPLLLKELHEQAARRRSAISRVLFAVLVYAIFLIGFQAEIAGRGRGALGQGDELFAVVATVQFLAIFLLLPMFLAGSVAAEKESDSLQLLVISRLTPTKILLQKLIARLVPFFSYIALTVPLLGFAYSLGGIEIHELVSLVYVLFLSAIHVGCFALLVSSWSLSTVGAFVGVYALGFGMYLGPGLLTEALDLHRIQEEAWSLFPFAAYVEEYRNGPLAVAKATWYLIPGAGVLFIAAEKVFLRRAFVRGAGLARRSLKMIDRVMNRANKIFGGARVGHEREELPDHRPLRWREVQQRGLDRPHHLVRMTLLVLVPVVIAGIAAVSRSPGRAEDSFAVLLTVLWCVAALLVTVISANLVVSERSNQTLDVLLTLPRSTESMLREKMAPVYRWICIFGISFAAAYLMSGYNHDLVNEFTRSRRDRESMPSLLYLAGAMALVAIYLPMISWLALWIGLRLKTRVRCILTAVLAVAAWQLLPFALFFVILINQNFRIADELSYILLASPATFIFYWEYHTQAHGMFDNDFFFPCILNFGGYFVVGKLLKWGCLRHARRSLQRP